MNSLNTRSFHPHRELEQYLRRQDFGFKTKTELRYAILRANVFQEDLMLFAEEVKKKHRLHLPIGNQPEVCFAPISVKDIAEVAGEILTGSDNDLMKAHHGHIYELTGPESVTGKDIATALSKVVGHSVEFDGSIPKDGGKNYFESLIVPPDLDHPIRHHLPLSGAHELQELFKLVHDGILKDTKPDLKKLIGKEGQTLQEFFERRCKYFVTAEE